MNAEPSALRPIALELMQKDLIMAVADNPGGGSRLELSPAGYEAALARNYVRLD